MFRAVDQLSLQVHGQQTLGVVGESGCGKSITALAALRLLPQGAQITGGSIYFDGRDLLKLSPGEMLKVRGGQIAMIFQEPMSSLNPVMSIGEQIVEAVLLHQPGIRHRQALVMAAEALHEVGIASAASRLRAYPHQFSGGMRQRVMIAMALACRPRILLADEPTTALDVTVQAQILELLAHLQRERGMGIMFISHDLGLVARHAHVTCVMYAGRVLEYGPTQRVMSHPLHPYTRALLKCRPSMSVRPPRLRTVTEMLEQPGEFAPLSSGAMPWWPTRRERESEAGVAVHDALTPQQVEIAPGHWVSCVASA